MFWTRCSLGLPIGSTLTYVITDRPTAPSIVSESTPYQPVSMDHPGSVQRRSSESRWVRLVEQSASCEGEEGGPFPS